MRIRKGLNILPWAIAPLLLLLFATVPFAEAHNGFSSDAPHNLSVTSFTHNSVSLSWDQPHGSRVVEGYKVIRRDIVRDPPGRFSTVGAIYNSNTTTFTDTAGVRAGTKYAYRVKAWNEAQGVGPKSNFVNVTTRQPPEPDTPEPEPVDPNTVACSAGNDSQWITSRSAFTRSGYTYYGCDVTKKFDKSQGPEKRPRYQVLSCDTNWKCGWKNG